MTEALKKLIGTLKYLHEIFGLMSRLSGKSQSEYKLVLILENLSIADLG
jgi:hypothetical protein